MMRWQAWQRWLDGVGERPFPLVPDVRTAWERHYNDDGPKPGGPYAAWVETLEDLKERGYEGVLSMECEGQSGPLIEKSLGWLRTTMKELGIPEDSF